MERAEIGLKLFFWEGTWREQKSHGEIRVHLLLPMSGSPLCLHGLVLLAGLHGLVQEGIKSPISFLDYQD